jgi:hypothetical protein
LENPLKNLTENCRGMDKLAENLKCRIAKENLEKSKIMHFA